MRRREFLKTTGAALAAPLAGPSILRSAAPGRPGPNERVRVGVIGVRGRGANLLSSFAAAEDVDVRYVCDVDSRILASRTEETETQTGKRPTSIRDFRRTLDDPSIDALVLGTPDHWHAIPTILACEAGKDVYTEKPDGHDAIESLRMADAARHYRRIVQMGTQARSAPHMHEAMEYIRGGAIGKVRYATAWESARQRSLGHPPDREPPEGVDYDLWLGPAPERPFNPLRFHGNWRWFFDYGTGDLGNDGVHRIDYARWGLQVALEAEGKHLPVYPQRVSALGGKLAFDDAQEWPDTLMVSWDFESCLLTYEMRLWSPYPHHGHAEGAAVYGDRGWIVLALRGWRAFEAGGEEIARSEGSSRNLDQTALHVRDFLDCMRSRKRPAADLPTGGHPASMLCHLGNAAWRARRTLRFDAEDRRFTGDADADRHLGREEYRAPWRLPEVPDGEASG